MKYYIYEEFMELVTKKLKRIEKKCKKYGNDFVFEITGEKIVPDEKKENVFYKFIEINVEGTAKIDNYEFIATLENTQNGNIIRAYNTDVEIPERFRSSKPFCEHCGNHNKRIKKLYIIRNIETNEFKQVGGNCLNLYTGGLSLDYVAGYMDGITLLEENNGNIGEGYVHYYSVDDVISIADNIINKFGYFNSNSDLPTKSLVATYLFKHSVDDCNKILQDYHEFLDDKDMTFSNDERICKIKNYWLNLPDDNNFVSNIKILIKNEYVKGNDLGFLSYVPEGYNRFIKKEKEREIREKNKELSSYFGVVGERYKNHEFKSLQLISCYMNDFGIVHIYKIIDNNGCTFIWKTSKSLDVDKIQKGYFDFTVKKHNEYNNEKQTEITRAKICL